MRFILLCLLLGSALSLSAQSRSFQLIDGDTGQPVPYATIQTGPREGTISNEEGFFSLNLQLIETVAISCMGYRSEEKSAGDLMALNGPIKLQPAAINLNEVRLTNRTPTANEILQLVRSNLDKNYVYTGQGFRIFYRESEHMQFDALDLELEKASDLSREALAQADARLGRLASDIVKSNPRKYLDFNGTIAISSDSTKVLRLENATELVDHHRDYSLDQIEERARNIVLSHLDTTKTYKVKTGIFKIEDSLSMAEDWDEDSGSDSTELSYLRNKSGGLLDDASWKDGTLLKELLDGDAYRYHFIKATYFDGNYVYAVGFEPDRRKAKFEGVLYVDAASYAVLKADYGYARGRRGEKVNLKLLLGIKYIENMYSGTVIYKRNFNNTYSPYYIQKENGNYVYIHRDFKFIENSPSRKKVRFDFLLEGGVREREALLVSPMEPSETSALLTYSQPKKIKIRSLERYEPTIWQETQVIEPLEEMKNFRVSPE